MMSHWLNTETHTLTHSGTDGRTNLSVVPVLISVKLLSALCTKSQTDRQGVVENSYCCLCVIGIDKGAKQSNCTQQRKASLLQIYSEIEFRPQRNSYRTTLILDVVSIRFDWKGDNGIGRYDGLCCSTRRWMNPVCDLSAEERNNSTRAEIPFEVIPRGAASVDTINK